MKKKQPQSYVVLAALAGGVLYFVLDLSSAGRGPIDYAVIGLVALAVLWNIIQLSRRLYRDGGGRVVWRVQRTALLWVVGVFDTALLRPENAGGWRNWLGWAILVLAAIDTIALYFLEKRGPSRPDEPADSSVR